MRRSSTVSPEEFFINEYGPLNEWDFENGTFRLNNNFGILQTGLIFCFNPYEVGSYAAGSPMVFIPYAEIAGLIRPDGILSRFGQFKEQPSDDMRRVINEEAESINTANLVKDSIIGFADYAVDGGILYFFKDQSGSLRKMEWYLPGEGSRMISSFYISLERLILYVRQIEHYIVQRSKGNNKE